MSFCQTVHRGGWWRENQMELIARNVSSLVIDLGTNAIIHAISSASAAWFYLIQPIRHIQSDNSIQHDSHAFFARLRFVSIPLCSWRQLVKRIYIYGIPTCVCVCVACIWCHRRGYKRRSSQIFVTVCFKRWKRIQLVCKTTSTNKIVRENSWVFMWWILFFLCSVQRALEDYDEKFARLWQWVFNLHSIN